MRTNKKRPAMMAGILSLALVAAACGGDDDGGSDGSGGTGASGLTGTVVISGSSTVEPISALVAEKFAAANPEVNITVDGPGTSDGFELFCAGETDVSDASRPIDPDEVKACEKAGIEFVELEVALDGITVMTNPANSAVTCLGNGDLYALTGPESNGVDTWAEGDSIAEAISKDATLVATPYPDVSLDVVGPGEESGTYDAYIELAGFEDIALAQGVSEDKAATTRSDYQSSPNDNVIIQGIEGSDSSLGWVGFAFAQNAGEGVKELEIDGGDGCVAPTTDTIADGSYPLSRSLYIYVNTANIADNAALAAYVDTYLSEEGLASVTETSYVDLPADRIQATQAAWETASA